jgi:hypothetical protein
MITVPKTPIVTEIEVLEKCDGSAEDGSPLTIPFTYIRVQLGKKVAEFAPYGAFTLPEAQKYVLGRFREASSPNRKLRIVPPFIKLDNGEIDINPDYETEVKND